jgi:hypothetical protein
MSNYFSEFESTSIYLHQYKYEPLTIFLKSYSEIKLSASNNSIHYELAKHCKSVVHNFIAGKAPDTDLIHKVKELCRSTRTATTKSIHNSVKYLNFNDICFELIENFYIENEVSEINCYVESVEQWYTLSQHIVRADLEGIFKPVFKNDLTYKFFEKPILFILPPHWVSTTLVLPPASILHFIYPTAFDFQVFNNKAITSNSGQSIEFMPAKLDVKRNVLELDPPIEFSELFKQKKESYEENQTLHDDFEEFNYDSINTLTIKHKNGETNLLSQKKYLVVDNESNLKFTSFENQSELKNIKYVVSSLDYSRASNKSLMDEQFELMEVWKKPLRDSVNNYELCKKLKHLGSEKANLQNVKNWYAADRIAPRGEYDYRAVLKYAGIFDEEEIKKYFYLAYKQRGTSISVGHKRAYLAGEIVRRHIGKYIETGKQLIGTHHISGIQFIIEGIYK